MSKGTTRGRRSRTMAGLLPCSRLEAVLGLFSRSPCPPSSAASSMAFLVRCEAFVVRVVRQRVTSVQTRGVRQMGSLCIRVVYSSPVLPPVGHTARRVRAVWC